jgi:hypothetical protein
MQAVHSKALSCSVIAKGMKEAGDKFKSLRRLSKAVDAAGEKGAPLHLKFKVMHDDVQHGAISNVFPIDEIASILMQRQWYLKSLDHDGKRTLANVYKEVYKQLSLYYDLIITCKDEGKYDIVNALELYELFHWIRRQSTRGKYLLGCTCSDSSTDCVCEHILLKCAAFDATVQGPNNWVAETQKLHKKTNRLWAQPAPGEPE